ncbi:glycosyltransferase family 25 protein [Rhizobium sp. 0TCS1.26]|uniref:glycosyltransferase family 25 protein n=1 Tax=Rhizobium sp. 0TCS1.26 TaxID=3142623 RepID=UPI003D2AEC4E
MTLYVINLDRAADRMARMQRLLDSERLAFERIPAVDGRGLDPETLAAWSHRHADGSLILSVGEVGILMSQRQAWRRIADSGEPGVVFEDDIHLADGARDLLSDLCWLPADADIVKIETTGRTVAISRRGIAVAPGLKTRSVTVSRLRSAHLGAAGYIITPEAAGMLLHNVGRCDRAVDHVIFDPASPLFARLRIYQMVPALCIQDQFETMGSIGLGGEIVRAWALEKKKRRRTLFEKASREIGRLGAQAGFVLAGLPFNPLADRRNLKVPFAGMETVRDGS